MLTWASICFFFAPLLNQHCPFDVLLILAELGTCGFLKFNFLEELPSKSIASARLRVIC